MTAARPPAEEVNNLLKALVLFQYHRQAEALQLTFQQALQTMEAAVPEVWPEGLRNAPAPVKPAKPGSFHRGWLFALALTGGLVFLADWAKLDCKQHHGFIPAAAAKSFSFTTR